MKLMILMLLVCLSTTGATMNVPQDITFDTIVGEIIELRGEQLKVFALGDGTYEYRYYTNPVHYWDGYSMKEITEKEKSIKNDNLILYDVNENIIKNFKDEVTNSYLYENFLSKNSAFNELSYKNFKSEKNK